MTVREIKREDENADLIMYHTKMAALIERLLPIYEARGIDKEIALAIIMDSFVIDER